MFYQRRGFQSSCHCLPGHWSWKGSAFYVFFTPQRFDTAKTHFRHQAACFPRKFHPYALHDCRRDHVRELVVALHLGAARLCHSPNRRRRSSACEVAYIDSPIEWRFLSGEPRCNIRQPPSLSS